MLLKIQKKYFSFLLLLIMNSMTACSLTPLSIPPHQNISKYLHQIEGFYSVISFDSQYYVPYNGFVAKDNARNLWHLLTNNKGLEYTDNDLVKIEK